MGTIRVAVLMALMLAVTVSGVYCVGGKDREAISTEVATEWVQGNIDTVSDVLVELLTVAPALRDTVGKIPGAETLLAGLVADQIKDNIAWSYSTPALERQALYRVTATAALEIEIDLPLVGAWQYAVTLPFHLLIDTDAEKIQEWTADFDNAAVASY